MATHVEDTIDVVIEDDVPLLSLVDSEDEVLHATLGPQGGTTEISNMAAAGPSTSIQVEHSDTQQSTSDTEIVQCECQTPVTEEDFRQLVRNMPRRTYRHILEACFNIPEDSLQTGEPVSVILHRWSQNLGYQLTRSKLYNKLLKAKRLGLCSTTTWCEFLVPSACILECQFTAENDERDHSCAECNTRVTEQELSQISRTMPPRMWKHICRECLEISDNTIHGIEYGNAFRFWKNTIFDVLKAWSLKEVNPTRGKFYEKLLKAIDLGICESTEWFDFLIPPSCQTHFPIQERGIHDTESQQVVKVSKSKQLLAQLLKNSLRLHIMLVSLFIKLNYGISDNISNSTVFIHSLIVLYGITCEWGKTVMLPFICSGTFEKILSGICRCAFGKSLPGICRCAFENILPKYVPKLNLMFLLLAIVNFLAILVLESSASSFIVTSIVQWGFLMLTICTTVMTSHRATVDTFWFVTQRDIVTVYGKYRPHCSTLETVVSYLTWSYTGILMAYIIMYVWELNATTIIQLSVLTQIAIITIWLMTLNEKSFYMLRDIQMLFKALLSWNIPVLIILAVFACIWPIWPNKHVDNSWFNKHVDNNYDLIACSSLPSGPPELVTSCLVTLTLFILYRTFSFLSEEKRSIIWEECISLLMLIIVSFVLAYRWSRDFNAEFGWNMAIRLFLILFNPLSPYELCAIVVSHNTTENTTVTQSMFNMSSTSFIDLTTMSP